MRSAPVLRENDEELHSATPQTLNQSSCSRREALFRMFAGTALITTGSDFLHADEMPLSLETKQIPLEEYDKQGRLIKKCIQSNTGEISHKFMFGYHEDNWLQRRSYYKKKGEIYPLTSTDLLWQNGKPQQRTHIEADVMQWFSPNGTELFRQFHRSNPQKRENYLIDRHKRLFGDFRTEQRKNKSLTAKKYIEALRKAVAVDPGEGLIPEERIAVYLQFFLQYEREPGDENIWHTPEETIRLGKHIDCEDYSLLAMDLLQAQNRIAFPLYIPNHCVCICVERKRGKYHACTLDNFGLDNNGNRYGSYKQDPKKWEGYDTAQQAVDSVLAKYREPNSPVKMNGFTVDVHAAETLNVEKHTHFYQTDLLYEAVAGR